MGKPRMVEQITGAELATLRKAAGMNQTQLGKAARCCRHTVSFWENYAGPLPERPNVLRFGKVLGFKICRPSRTPTRARGHGVLDWQTLFEQMVAYGMSGYVRRMVKREAFRRVQCEARTRKGHPCKLKSEPGRERCKFHGGRSTGPKTVEGRERIAQAQRERWAKWRVERG